MNLFMDIEAQHESSTRELHSRASSAVLLYFQKWRGVERGWCGGPPWRHNGNVRKVLTACVSTFLGLAVLGLLDSPAVNAMQHTLIASFGASVVVFYCMPEAAASQPRNAILGSLIGATFGVICRNISIKWLAGALSVTITVGGMLLTKSVHPPAGATAFVLATTSDPILIQISYLAIVLPVMVGEIFLMAIALVLNNIWFQWPQYWL